MRYSDFKKSHNPESLLSACAKIFPCDVPWVERDITKESWNSGQWRLMESPLFWLVSNCLILDPNNEPFYFSHVYGCGECDWLYHYSVDYPYGKSGFVLPDRDGGLPSQEFEKFEASDLIPMENSPYLNTKHRRVENWIDRGRTLLLLGGQCGKKLVKSSPETDVIKTWLCPENGAPSWKTGLATALYLHGRSDAEKKTAREILDAMNVSMGGSGNFNPDKIDTGPAKPLEWPEFDGRAEKMLAPHTAFENVFFMALLEYARTRGVLSTAQFGWVKAFDRALWYALSQTGRKVACAEAAGAFSHYNCEKIAGKPLEIPCVVPALEGFVAEMKNEGWLPKDYVCASRFFEKIPDPKDDLPAKMNELSKDEREFLYRKAGRGHGPLLRVAYEAFMEGKRYGRDFTDDTGESHEGQKAARP